MSLAKEEAKKLLRKMPLQKRAEVLEKILKVRTCDIDEIKNIFESTADDVREVIGLFVRTLKGSDPLLNKGGL